MDKTEYIYIHYCIFTDEGLRTESFNDYIQLAKTIEYFQVQKKLIYFNVLVVLLCNPPTSFLFFFFFFSFFKP